MSPRADRPGLGVALMAGAFVAFTGIDLSARWLGREAGLPPFEIGFVRYLAHLLIVSALFLPVYGAGLWRTARPGGQTRRGLFLMGSTLFNFVAIAHLPLSLTASIFFATPLLICALSVPMLGEKVGPRRWTAVILGLVGVLMVTRPWEAQAHWAMAFSAGAVLCSALYAIETRKLAGVDGADTQQFWAAAVATLGVGLTAGLASGYADWVWPSRPIDWAFFGLVGLAGWAGHQLFIIAHRYATAATLAPVVYVALPSHGAADWLAFGLAPDPWMIPGVAVVIAAGLYVWVRERQLGKA